MSSIRNIWLPANSVIRSARQMINARLRPLGLSSKEGNILLHMAMRPDPMSQEQLAAQLDVDKAAVSRAAGSLVRKGFITRGKDTGDKRLSRLCFCPKGREVLPQVERIYNDVYAAAVRGLSSDDFELLGRLLEQIARNLAPGGGKGPDGYAT